MKIMKFFSVFCFCLFACTGMQCTSKGPSTDDSVLTVRLDDVKEKRTIPLSSLVENCKLVRFENSDSAYFKRWVAHVSDHYIGIRQSGKPFKLFDHDGKFLGNVGAIGQGPGEYGSLYDEQIDEANGKIYLMGFSYVKNLLEYDLNGRFIRAIPLTYELKKPKFRVLPDQTFSVVHMPFGNDKAMGIQYASDGQILREMPVRDDVRVGNYNGELFSYGNTPAFDFMHTSVDTLYHYDMEKSEMTPVFTMQFPNPDDKPIHIYAEMPGYYLTLIFDKGLIATDKKDGSSFYMQVVNDYCGNMKLPPLCFNKGWLTYSVDPMNFRDLIEERLSESDCSEKDKEQLNALVNTLHENDNDLMFIGKLKQN